jgi:hypothetical protein
MHAHMQNLDPVYTRKPKVTADRNGAVGAQAACTAPATIDELPLMMTWVCIETACSHSALRAAMMAP